jgi:hypothetical protein
LASDERLSDEKKNTTVSQIASITRTTLKSEDFLRQIILS